MLWSKLNSRRFSSVLILGILLVSAFAAILITRPIRGEASWWNTSWQYRKEITIDNTMVDGDLINFPVLIDTTDPDLADHAQSGGDDIVFTDEAGTQLSHEIESYDGGTGHLVAWVNADLSSTTDTVLYMYYGNAGASNQEDVTGVWDSNYVMVQHLEETAPPSPLPWNKYGGNPILSGSQNGFASVFYDSATELYHLFCSWGSILHFTSLDGQTGWTADPENPVLSGNNEGVPMAWKEGDTWYMLYRYGSPINAIGLATSTDATVWTRYVGNPVLQLDPPGFIDPWGVIKVDSTYYLWYNDGFGTGSRAVGLATSTDLMNWTPDPNNPIFTGGRFCVFPFKYGGYYYMLVPRYTPYPYGEIELYRDINPTFYPASREYLGVVIVPGAEGEWDDRRFDTPCVLTDTIYRDTYLVSNNELWTYYAATGTPTGSGADWWTGLTIETNIADALPDPVDVTVYDSTSNNNDGDVIGGVNLNVVGQIDGADDFDGSDSYIDCGDSESLKGMDTLTIEAWFKPEAWNNGVMSKWGGWTAGTGGSWIMFQGSSGNIGWGVITETGWASMQPSTLPTGAWYHLVGVYDGSQIRMYVNGVQDGTPQAISGRIASTDHSCYIGRYTTVRTTGTIDEVRISNIARSEDWISTQYNNQYSPSTFYTVGTEEMSEANVPPVASDLVITPSLPYTTDDLVGSYAYYDADGDPDSGTEIRWYKDDVLQLDYNDLDTVSSLSTAPGEVWHFTVRPSDGTDYGELKISPPVIIRTDPGSYIFTDGFEIDFPGNWDNQYQSGGTITQSSEQMHHESYSAEATVTSVNGYGVVSETLPLLSTAYMRCYVYFTAFPADGDQTCFLRSSGDMGNWPQATIVAATVYNDSGTVKWALVYEDAGDYRAIADTPLPQLNTWYCVEIKTLVDGASGEARMIVNNVEILTQIGLDNDVYGSVEFCVAGSTALPLGTNGVSICYVDCVVVAETYIGTEEAPPPDVNPPTYSNVGTNTTLADQPCLFHAEWTDDTELSGFIFRTNNTGVWVDDAWTPLSGTLDWSNVTKILNPTPGVIVAYQFDCYDTSNNMQSTPIQQLIVTGPVKQLFSISSNSTVSHITFDSTAMEINCTVTGPSGTTGYLEILLSKDLVPDITDLIIYFDETEMSYEALSVDDLWLINLTYDHSTHSLRIVLSSASPTPVTIPTKLIVSTLIATVASLTLLALSRKKKTKK